MNNLQISNKFLKRNTGYGPNYWIQPNPSVARDIIYSSNNKGYWHVKRNEWKEIVKRTEKLQERRQKQQQQLTFVFNSYCALYT